MAEQENDVRVEELDKLWWVLTDRGGLTPQEVTAMRPEPRRKLTAIVAQQVARELLETM